MQPEGKWVKNKTIFLSICEQTVQLGSLYAYIDFDPFGGKVLTCRARLRVNGGTRSKCAGDGGMACGASASGGRAFEDRKVPEPFPIC
jgi:hypothetical protein